MFFKTCTRSFSPLSVSRSDTPARARHPSQTLFREREETVLRMGRDLPSGLGIASTGRPSNFVPFGGRLMPQRLTMYPESPFRLHAFHIMSSCAYHLHTCSSHASELFPCCPFCNPALLCHPASPFCLFSCAGVKHSRNGPSLAKRPWYSTGRLPVKFRAIWSPFDTPTVNRVTVKALFVLHPNTPPKWPITHPNPLHALGRSITIVWVKTAPHLDSPSSLYL